MDGSLSASNDENSFREHHLPRGGGSLYVRDYAGSGPAFVLLHGFPDNLRIYDRLIPFLQTAGRRVVTFDFLGFGASDKPDGFDYGFEQQLEDLEVVVSGLALERIVPVGHDAGGPAAINFAIDHPDLVSSLCLLNSFFGAAPTLKVPELIELFATPSLSALTQAMLKNPEQLAFVLRFQQLEFLKTLPSEFKAGFEAHLAPIINNNFNFGNAAGSERAFAQMTAALLPEVRRNTGRLPLLEALELPIRLIWGSADGNLNTGVAQDFQSHAKHASLVLLRGGHWIQIDMPEEVAKAMLDQG